MDIRPLGDQAVRLHLGREISPEVHRRVRRFCRALAAARPDGVTEWVPAYTTVAVYYQPHRVRYGELCARLATLEGQGAEEDPLPASVTEIPVCYGGADGPDLEHVGAYHGRMPEEVIALHAQPTYLVYLLGFLPGFPYLGGLPPELATPRRPTPRTRVPAGSVGIAGAQTGVYPFATPGGWQIIGRTPLVLYDVGHEPPALLRAGDYVRFVPVTEQEAAEIARRVAEGGYEPRRYPYAD